MKFGEFAISPQDERLLLAQQWLEAVPHAHEIFDLLENANQVCDLIISVWYINLNHL